MKQQTWHKHHKWSGLALCFFLLMLCLSGIALNHRALIAEVNVSRGLLPPWYRFHNWNNGLLRGTIALAPDTVLIYGAGGVFLSHGDTVADFNQGLPTGADRRAMRAMVRARDGRLFALSQFGLFTRGAGAESWTEIPVPTTEEERLSDLVLQGDTLVAVGRSRLYIASVLPHPTGASAQRDRLSLTPLSLQPAEGEQPRVSLFKTLWRLHSGELFGLPGKLVADAIALVLLFLAITGALCWLLPKGIKRRNRRRIRTGSAVQAKEERTARHPALATLRLSHYWHNRVGRLTIILTALIVLTGWCLRPPLMVPLALASIPQPTREAAWHDQLRALRYDGQQGDWLLFTADGFYALPALDGVPVKEEKAPAVSVMGINVWERNARGDWLVGSFSGMSIWARHEAQVYDYFTLLPVDPSRRGAPFGQVPVSGYSAHLTGEPLVVTYSHGTDALPQPAALSRLPMSLWNVALEVHTGRIYFADAATYFWIFLVGALALWCLWSGWKIRRK